MPVALIQHVILYNVPKMNMFPVMLVQAASTGTYNTSGDLASGTDTVCDSASYVVKITVLKTINV